MNSLRIQLASNGWIVSEIKLFGMPDHATYVFHTFSDLTEFLHMNLEPEIQSEADQVKP